MHSVVDPLLVVILLLNFFLLGTTRLRAAIAGSAAQGVILGLLAALVHVSVGPRPLLIAAGAAFIKGLVIPVLLIRAMRDAGIRREIDPLVGFIPSLLLGAIALAVSLIFAQTLPVVPSQAGSLLLPASFATVLTGFIVLTTRRKAITQVVGYLTLENGIFIMGLSILEAMPFLVEIGVLLDLFVGIFVMGIIINHINREFSSLDTSRLSALKE